MTCCVRGVQARFAEAVAEARELRREGDASAPEVLSLRAAALYGSGNLDLATRCYAEARAGAVARVRASVRSRVFSLRGICLAGRGRRWFLPSGGANRSGVVSEADSVVLVCLLSNTHTAVHMRTLFCANQHPEHKRHGASWTQRWRRAG